MVVHAHVLRLPCGIWAHFLARARTHKQFNAGYQAHQLTADSCTRGPEHSAQRGAQSSSKSSAGRVPGPASPIDPLSRKPATSAELLPLVDLYGRKGYSTSHLAGSLHHSVSYQVATAAALEAEMVPMMVALTAAAEGRKGGKAERRKEARGVSDGRYKWRCVPFRPASAKSVPARPASMK